MPLGGQTRIEGIKKTSLRVSNEAVGIAFGETQREANACAFSSACAVSIETSYISFDDCFAAQIDLSLRSGERRFHRNRPTVAYDCGRPLPAYDPVTELSDFPFFVCERFEEVYFRNRSVWS